MSFFDDLLVLFTDKDGEDEEKIININDDGGSDNSSNSGKKSEINLFKVLDKLPVGIILLVLLLIYSSTGIYKVGPKEVGVVTRFGKYIRQAESGLHYHLPYPIEKVYTPQVTRVKRIELGFRTIDPGPPARYSKKKKEALMLTGDLAIVSANAVIKYKIKDPIQYLFWIKNPDDTVRDASEAALRQVVGQNNIQAVLTGKKTQIQLEAKELIQKTLDDYHAGIYINNFLFQDVSVPEPVEDAYRDVASAKEDKHTKVNQAQAHRSQIIPTAKGEASKIVKEAEGYKAKRIAEAEGNVARFNKLLEKYKAGKDVTRTRLYLETMEDILPELNKIIVGNNSQGVLKMLNLDKVQEEGVR
ncbi:FtsH protease activity modulator HflK [Selenihalanaerobacter shriftii]|uniref:Protein HflK n=1 Tax=Selenihalanaerobacter shriftii TaxID=142842 RepID=A0A1T4PV63_9FIRM|nr:FtsH protease activity modulator HflK [Selenihalanaerobacter shriftii]SJZ95440.1 membrane protease subunit HflK [Selenihalanaerobacter shriftii]